MKPSLLIETLSITLTLTSVVQTNIYQTLYGDKHLVSLTHPHLRGF